MDFEFTEEQNLFRESLRDFLAKEFPEDKVNKRDAQGPWTKEECIEVLKKLKKLGIGLDLESAKEVFAKDPVIFGIMSEEVSRVWASILPLLGMGALPAAYAPFASDDIQDKMMKRLERAEFIGAFAETEPEAGCDTRSLKATAKLDGEGYVINGTKTWITNGTVADTVLVGAIDSQTGAESFYLVEKETSPFETSELHKIGWNASPTGELYFNDCRTAKENEMSAMITKAVSKGDLTEVMPISEGVTKLFSRMTPITALLTLPRAGMGLSSVGIAQAAYEKAVEYAKERKQFGKPIGKFQLIQEMLYNMSVRIETARLLAYKAIDVCVKGHPAARRLSSMAKVYAGEMAVKVTYDAMQVHGGMGLSTELSLERYFRDARMMTVPDGTSEIMKLVTGYEILGKGFSAYV